ncbi:hypothetical protein ACIBEJ_11625 [Nonomuraea sp. NPDC050790]|uniref:hypothetical protein n=1 Tax=Nonomuraea sp. NPDC050790 TaxID=3364371 RepID=UPI00379FCFF1
MTLTEQDLRELLDSDSLDARHRGVSVADVDRRVRRIRTRRVRAVTALAAVAAAVAVLSSGTATPAHDVWEGVMAGPLPTSGDWELREPVVLKQFTRGGVRRTATFESTAPHPMAVVVTCRSDTYLLVWLNGLRVANEPCVRGAGPPRWLRADLRSRAGRNTVSVLLVPRSAVPGGTLTAAAADAMASRSTPFEVTWTLQVMERDTIPACDRPVVITDPGSGREVLSWTCPEPVLKPDSTGT